MGLKPSKSNGVKDLVHSYSKAFRRSKELAGRDLTGWRLDFADLRGSDMRGCILNDTELRGAIMNDVDLEGATLISEAEHRKCDLTGARMRGANLTDCGVDFHTSLVAVDLEGATFKNTRLEPNGYWSRGVVLPKRIPFEELSGCRHGNQLIARLIYDNAEDNEDLKHIARFAHGKAELDRLPPCWTGFYAFCRKFSDETLEGLERILGLYPGWGLMEMWAKAKESPGE